MGQTTNAIASTYAQKALFPGEKPSVVGGGGGYDNQEVFGGPIEERKGLIPPSQ